MMEKMRKLIHIEGSHTMKISCDFLLLDFLLIDIELLFNLLGEEVGGFYLNTFPSFMIWRICRSLVITSKLAFLFGVILP